MKRIAIALLLLGLSTLAAADCEANGYLGVDGTLEENGWTLAHRQSQDVFTVKDGVLTCSCAPTPMKGVKYCRQIEFPPVGEMSYEVRLFVAGHTDRYVLQVCIGEFMMSFCRQSLIRHFPVLGLKYPNWTTVAKDRIPGDTWTKVRLRWNTEKRTVKYYVGEDQSVPSFVDRDVTINPGKGGMYNLVVGNYGLHNDHEVHQLRNFEIRAIDEGDEKAKIARDMAIVFAGLCSEYFPIAEWTKGFAADKVVSFNLEYDGYNYSTENRLSLSGCPDDDLCCRAKLIILCDMPLEKKVLSYECQELLLDAVGNGARMLVTGGLAGLQRCGDFDSPIAKALPCEFTSAFKAPAGGDRFARDYGAGKIVILNKRKVQEPCTEQ